MTERDRFAAWWMANATMGSSAWDAWQAALAQQREPVDGKPVAWLKTMYSGTRPMLEVDHLCLSTSVPAYLAPTIPDGWISVIDKRPPEDLPVWLYEHGRGIWVGSWSEAEEGWLWHNCYSTYHLDKDDQWAAYDMEQDDDYQPTHWMPLPSPPAAVKEPK